MTENQRDITFLGGHHSFLGQQMTITAADCLCAYMVWIACQDPGWLFAMQCSITLDLTIPGIVPCKPFYTYLGSLFMWVWCFPNAIFYDCFWLKVLL